MPRTRPTDKPGIYGGFDPRPEVDITSYIESKLHTKNEFESSFKEKPDFFQQFVLQSEKDHYKAETQQKELMTETKKYNALRTSRIKAMYKIQQTIRDQLISINDFMKHSTENVTNAEKNILKEEALHQELETNIVKLTKDIDELEDFEKILNETVKQFEPYEKVIQDAVNETAWLQSINDCMTRADASMLAQVEIVELQNNKLKDIENLKNEMTKTTNETSEHILGLVNDLNNLERGYHSAKAKTLKWEKILSATKDIIMANDFKRNQMSEVIYQMYSMLCKRSGFKEIFKPSNVDRQIDFIVDEIKILEEVVKRCCSDAERPKKLSPLNSKVKEAKRKTSETESLKKSSPFNNKVKAAENLRMISSKIKASETEILKKPSPLVGKVKAAKILKKSSPKTLTIKTESPIRSSSFNDKDNGAKLLKTTPLKTIKIENPTTPNPLNGNGDRANILKMTPVKIKTEPID